MYARETIFCTSCLRHSQRAKENLLNWDSEAKLLRLVLKIVTGYTIFHFHVC